MSEHPEPSVMGSLPSSRPHRRSAKRPARAGAESAPAKTQNARPKPAARGPAAQPPSPPSESAPGALETAVQAAAELAEIGLRAGARALRGAVSRLPRP